MNNDKINQVLDNLKRSWEDPFVTENMESSEKVLSLGAGAFIFLSGIGSLLSHPIMGIAKVAVGGGLVYRGLTGYCPVKALSEETVIEPTLIVNETIIVEDRF